MSEPRTGDPSGVPGSLLADALSRLASGVVLLTAHDDEEGDAAITATSFTSVSLSPPLVLVALTEGSWMHEVLDRTGRWAVSVLAERHRSAAARFSSGQRPSPRVLLSGVGHHRAPLTGAFVLDDALATLECHTEQTIHAGDHVLVVGLVVAAAVGAAEQAPLVRFRRRYPRLELG